MFDLILLLELYLYFPLSKFIFLNSLPNEYIGNGISINGYNSDNRI